jgi:hypothetical protein
VPDANEAVNTFPFVETEAVSANIAFVAELAVVGVPIGKNLAIY